MLIAFRRSFQKAASIMCGLLSTHMFLHFQVTPYNIPLNYCSIRDIWDREFIRLLQFHGHSNGVCPLELYKSAEVDARKQYISQFNEVCSHLLVRNDVVVICNCIRMISTYSTGQNELYVIYYSITLPPCDHYCVVRMQRNVNVQFYKTFSL